MEDELMVLIPMHLIERIRAEIRLQCGDWDELDRCIEAASDPKVLACDVRLPPATTFPAGTKASTLLMAIQMRADRPELERKFS